MRRISRCVAICVALIAMWAWAAQAETALPQECVTHLLPTDDARYPNDQIVLICVPAQWNGDVVVYAHGYVAPQLPLALPLGELTLPDGQTVPEIVLTLGYAFLTTSYHKNGYAVEQAGDDLNQLVDYFISEAAPGPVGKVYLAGASEGGLIITMLIERYPERYDAGLALCGPLGGARDQMRYLGDFRAVFDVFFPAVFDFGIRDVPADAYLSWDDVYVPAIIGEVLSHPYRTEQLFRVTRAAREPDDPATWVNTALSVLRYSVFSTNDIIDVAGGQPFGNLFTWYSGSSRDFALNARVERVRADMTAREYLGRFYETTGRLSRPLVTLHTTRDDLVPFTHEVTYLKKAFAAGRARNLTVIPVSRYGHCNFTGEEIIGAFVLMLVKAGMQ
jgi:pimeloyl-ACP methyl ester carboxylesterase